MAYLIKRDLDMWYVVFWQPQMDETAPCIPYALFPNAIDADDYGQLCNDQVDYGAYDWCCLGDWRWYPRNPPFPAGTDEWTAAVLSKVDWSK